MYGRLKYCKQKISTWLAFRRQYRMWKRVAVQHLHNPYVEKQLAIIPCDPWSVGGSRGDEAMMTAIILKYRKDHPAAPITIISEGDEGSKYISKLPYPGITPLPVWNGNTPVKTIYEAVMKLRPSDVVLLGADCMDGYYSPFISLTLLALHDLFSRTDEIKSHLTGFSFNRHPYRPLRKAFNSITPSARLYLRDAVSLERFKKFAKADAELTADAAFMLEADYGFDGYEKLKEWITTRRAAGTRHIIGFNFHPMLRRYDNTEEIQNDACSLARNIAAIMQRNGAIDFVLVPHDDRCRYTDNIMLKTIADSLIQAGFGSRTYYSPEVYRAAQIKALCSLLDGLASSRMHLAVAALGEGKSVLAAEYQGKFEGLFRHFNLPAEYLLTPDEFIGDAFAGRFEKYMAHLPELTRQVEKEREKVIRLSEKNLL